MRKIKNTIFLPDKTKDGSARRKIIKKTLAIFILAFGLMVATAVMILSISDHIEMSAYLDRAWNAVDMQASGIGYDISQVSSDLAILANQREIGDLWKDDEKPVPEILSEITEAYFRISMYRRLYDQVRLLDEYGIEIVRINFNNGFPAVVPQEELPSKKNRCCFTDAFALNRGEIFVSPLDLKTEHGKIEQPLKPMIHFATPVFGENGMKRGVVLLNYFGEKMLGRFTSHANVVKGSRSMLLNSYGHWILRPPPDVKREIIYTDRKDQSFANAYPEEWKKIKSEDACQFNTAKGLFTSKTVHPLIEGRKYSTGSGIKPSDASAYCWKIVSFTASEVLYVTRNHRRLVAAIALPFLALSLLAGLWWLVWSAVLREQSEASLRESKNHLQSVFRVAPTGLGVSRNRVLKQVNEHLCEMTGYSEEELVGQSTRILYPNEEDYLYIGSKKYSQIRDHGAGLVETRFKRKDERIINILFSSTPIDPMNLSKGVTFIAFDITERKQAEEALRISHERFLKVLDSIDATVYVADLDTYKILFMNEYMIQNFGRNMTGEICYKCLYEKSEPCTSCKNRQLTDKNGRSTGVCTWQDKNPITKKWYIYNDRTIEWTDGRLVKLQIASDITGFKKMEDELRQAHKMESIGTLAGGVAHDFNNILFMILGNAELALGDLPKNHPAYNFINKIKTASVRAAGIIKQLLNFSRKTNQEFKPIGAVSVIKDCLNFIRSSLPATIVIKKHLPEEDVTIMGDPIQINQVLINLCTNAFQAMEETGGILQIDVEKVVIGKENAVEFPAISDGDYLKITVKDSGPGIRHEIIDRIFDPYFTTKKIGKGSGLGLSVVHGIIKNHNGVISVQNQSGEGAVFTMLFPAIDKKPDCEKKTIDRLQYGKESILIVDDEEIIIEVTQKMLEKLGYEVEASLDPADALNKFRSSPDKFHLVITDMTMPQMTGAKLYEELKKIRSNIPVIICTGHSGLIDEEKAKQVGIAGYLTKPASISEIAKTVRTVLDGSHPHMN